MAQNITLMGATYNAVPAVQLPKQGGGTAQFDDTTDANATADDIMSGKTAYVNGTKLIGTASGGGYDTSDATAAATDVVSGKVFYNASGRQTGSVTSRSSLDLSASGATVTAPAGFYGSNATKTISSGSATPASTISGTSASVSTGTNTLTLSKTVSNTPSVSAGYISSGTAGNSSVSLTANVTTQGAQTIHPSTSNQTISSGRYLTGTQTINAVTTSNLTAENIKNGVTVTIGDTSDADCVASVTGTYSGGGGSSKNAQILQSTTRTTSTSYTKLCGDLTVSKTGTYDVYWTYFRSSTSGTWGSQLYIDNAAYGSQQTTYSNHVSNVHLSNVSLTVNQKVSVYGRSRGSNYYAYVGQLTIIEA